MKKLDNFILKRFVLSFVFAFAVFNVKLVYIIIF